MEQFYSSEKEENDVVETTRRNITQAGYANNKSAKQVKVPDYISKQSKK